MLKVDVYPEDMPAVIVADYKRQKLIQFTDATPMLGIALENHKIKNNRSSRRNIVKDINKMMEGLDLYEKAQMEWLREQSMTWEKYNQDVKEQ